MKPKVCMLVHNPPFQGGVVQFCVLLVNSLKSSIDLNVVGFKKLYPYFLYKGKLPKQNNSTINFEVPAYNFVTWYNPLSWIKAYNHMKKAEVIHLHWISPLLTPLQYTILKLNKMFAKKKVVLTCHNIQPHESTIFDKVFTKAIFSKVDHFVVHAKENKTRLIKEFGIKEDNISIIHHGDFSFFIKFRKETKQELKKEFNLENKKIILFFGYIRKYKGLRFLIKAMPKIIEKNKDVFLVVAGEMWEDLNEYNVLIKDNKIEDYVKIYPYYINDKEVHRFFDMADIVVLPYYNTEQTISGPLLVSLAFGKPTIVSNVGGIKETIKEGYNGRLVEGGNVEQLAEKANILLNDKKLQEKLSKNAVESIKKDNNWGDVARFYANLYESILNNK